MAISLTSGGAAVTESPVSNPDLLAAAPVDFSAGIPQSMAAPSTVPVFGENPWDVQAREDAARAAEDDHAARGKIYQVALDPDSYFKGKDMGFSNDPEKAKRLAVNSAFLEYASGQEAPMMESDIQRRLLRQQVAIQRFEGRGAESEDAFHAEVVKAATKDRDERNLGRDLAASASLAEFVRTPETTEGKSTLRKFSAWRKEAMGKPGYDAARDPDYFEAWTDIQRGVKQSVDAFRPELESVFTAFQNEEDYAKAAWDAWAKLPEDQRKPFMAALKMRSQALSQTDQDTFLTNFFKKSGRDIGGLFADTATAANDAMLSGGTVGWEDFLGSDKALAEKNARDRKTAVDFRQRSNFVADVVALQQETYDPIRYLAEPGALQRMEKIAYGTPGLLASWEMALVAAPALQLSLTESSYQTLRQRMLADGKSEVEADRIAGGLAPIAGAIEMFSERLGSELLLGKLPFLEKSLGGLIDRVSNPIARTLMRGAAGTAEEGLQEVGQNYIDPLVQQVGHALSADVPGVRWLGKGGEFDGDFSENLDSFLSCAPLVIFGMAGAVSKDSRVNAFRNASDAELKAVGIKDVPALREGLAKGVGSGDIAIEVAMETRDATTPEAKAAVAELKDSRASQAKAAAELEKIGYAAPRFVQTAEGITVMDGQSGEELGQAPDLSGALRIARAHTVALDDLETDQVAALGSIMEAARAAAELDPKSVVDVGIGETFDPEKASPENAARFAAQVALKEQAEGGTGDIARTVLGSSQTTFAQGLRTTVNRLFRGASVTDVFHETFHGLRRDAHAKGVLTVKDDIAELRRRDAILAGRKTKEGVAMQFIPDGITDDMLETGDIPAELIPAEFNGDGKRYAETLVDEGISEIAELETLKARKGRKNEKLGVGAATVRRNVTAMTRLSLAPESKFKAFMRAVKARFGLALSRAHAMIKAERDGKFDKAGSDAYLNKLLGLDEQQAHDDGVTAELNRIMGLPMFEEGDDIPFSIGRAETSVFAEASKPMANVQPVIGAFGREIGMTSGNGWNAQRGMSNNAARAIDEGKMPMPEFKEWLADTLGLENVPEIAIRRGNDAAGNHFREYHHMGRNRAEVDFYDPESIAKAPKFFLGMAGYFDTIKTGKKAAAASRKQALQAWKNLKQSLIEAGQMGDWKGSETKKVRNQSARMEALPDSYRAAVSDRRMTIDEAEVKAFIEATVALEKEAATLKAAVDKRQAQIAKWTKKIEAGEKAPYEGYLASQEDGLKKDAEKLAGVVEQLQKRTPPQSADAGRKMSEDRASSVAGFESRQSLGPQDGVFTGADASAFSIGPAEVADIMAGNALARVKDPIRRAQAMSRMARDFNALRMSAERSLHLSKVKRGKGELKREAAIMEEMLSEQYENEAYARHMGILTNEDLVKIKSQHAHEALAMTRADGSVDPFRGRIMSKKAWMDQHANSLWETRTAGDYDGSEGLAKHVFGGSLTPDQAAKELFDAHIIKENSTDALWAILHQEQASVAKMKEALVKAQEDIRNAKARAKQEANEWLAKQTGDQAANFSPKEEITRSLQMLDAILAALPPDVRGRLGGHTQMARIASDDNRLEFLKEKIAKADAELETYLKIQFGKEFEALLKRTKPERDEAGKKPKGKIGANVHDLFRAAEHAMGLDGRGVLMMIAEREAVLNDPDSDLTAEEETHLKNEIGLINLVGNWTKADAARREAALLEATRLYFGGYMAANIEAAAKRAVRFNRRGDLKAATGKSGKRMERVEKEIKASGTKIGRAKQTILSLFSFPQLVNTIFGEQSETARLLIDWERRASIAKEDAINGTMDGLDALFSRLAGGGFKGEELRWKLAQPGSVSVKLKTGPESFSEMEAITVTLMWMQEDGKRHMEGHMGEDGKPSGEWHWTQADVDHVESQLSNEAKAVRFHLMENYGGEYARLNEVFRGLYGVNMPRHKLYSPISVKPSQSAGGQMADPVSGTMTGPSLTPGSLRNRSQTAVAEPDFKDAVQLFIAHTKQMEHWMAYAPFATEAMAVLNSREVGNAVQAKAGQEALSVIRGWIDYFAQGGTRDAAAHLAGNQLVSRMLGRLSSAALVGRVTVLAIQSTQLGAAAYEMPTGAYLKGLGKLMLGRLHWGAALQSDYIQRRLKTMPPVVQEAMKGLMSSKPNKVKSAAREIGKLISGADALFTAGTFAIVYDWQLSQNGGDAAAARAEAERITDSVAQPIRAGERSLFEVTTTNPAVRLMWAFASEARQKAAITAYAFQNKSPMEKAKAAGVTWLLQGVIATLMRAVMRDLRSDDDDEIFDDRNWNPKRLALAAATGPLQGIPFLGDVVTSSLSKAFGVWMPEGTLLSSVANAADTLGSVGKYFEGEKDFSDVLKDAESVATGVAPVSDTAAAAASFTHILRDLYGIMDNLID